MGAFGVSSLEPISASRSRSFSGINHYDVSDPAGAQSYGLTLSDTSQAPPILAPSAGFEWTADHVSVAFVRRMEFLFAQTRTWALSMPLTVSWSWYEPQRQTVLASCEQEEKMLRRLLLLALPGMALSKMYFGSPIPPTCGSGLLGSTS